MEVRFFLLQGKLATVQLAPASVGPGRTVENLRFAHDLSARMSARYGPPFDCGSEASGASHFRCASGGRAR